MTVERGYAGLGRHWVRNAEQRDSQQAERDRKYKLRQQARDRARYLRRAADPEEYAAYLAKARGDQAVRDAAKRERKTKPQVHLRRDLRIWKQLGRMNRPRASARG